ncbi:MAG: L-serine ammonia-lyase, iron-sulfur-dependent, subunit alpha [bacterium]
MDIDEYLKLLKSEIKEVVGCTEPASIAYAVAKARQVLEKEISTPAAEIRRGLRVELELSSDVSRNVSTVRVPVVRKKGAAPAAACGLFASPDSFNPFKTITNREKKEINSLLEKRNWVDISSNEKRGVYVKASLHSGLNRVDVIVRGEHDHVEKIFFNDELIFQASETKLPRVENLRHARQIVEKDDGRLKEFVSDFLNRQSQLIKEIDYDNIIEAVEKVVLQRMEGESIRVQTITGSGNQGIFLGLPLYQKLNEEGDDFLEAALFTVLVQIYLTHREKRLTDKCGLITKSAPALMAGLLYYNKKPLELIKKKMELVAESARGVLCEGAKPSCALKAYMSLSMVEKIESMEENGAWKF